MSIEAICTHVRTKQCIGGTTGDHFRLKLSVNLDLSIERLIWIGYVKTVKNVQHCQNMLFC